jgi:two-component system, NarL family, invasion response regulator UvrY
MMPQTNQPKIRVSLADDHILLRQALASLIDSSDRCEVIQQFSNGAEVVNQLRKDNLPDVMILDMNMPRMDGHETAAWLQQEYPDIKVLMLTMYDSELALIRLLQVGVKGFMKKDIHPSELLHAIFSVTTEGYYYSSQTSSKLAGLFRQNISGESPLPKILFDPSEMEFLKLACTEMTYKEIAHQMHLNPRAIDGIRDNLFNRLDIKSRVGLVMYAIRHGVVTF